MEMTDGEIIRNYRSAKNPKEQIKILADLNDCDVSKIKEIVGERQKVGRLDAAMREINHKGVVPDAVYKAVTARLDEIEEVINENTQVIENAQATIKIYEREYRELADFMKGK